MSHIFISYSKQNITYANRLAEFLKESGFNIWIDQVGIKYGVDWWDAIVDGIDRCGAFIVVMTPEAKLSDWVKRETHLALQWKKPLFPILLNGDNWPLFVVTQYFDALDGRFPDDGLLKRISHHVTPRQHGQNQSTLTSKHNHPAAPADFDVNDAVANFGRAFREGNWSAALEILGRIKASGEDPTPFNPNSFEASVQQAIENEKREQERQAYEAERASQYRRLETMLDFADDEVVIDALRWFQENFGNYDPHGIADRVKQFAIVPAKLLFPAPFDWIDIPAGQVTLKDGHATFDVPAFTIAKYPVTVAQYEVFMNDGGYSADRWWTKSGWRWLQEQGYTTPRYWNDIEWQSLWKPDHPVVGISWFEAYAFTQWLSDKTGENIFLPTEQQWQRSAQGDDGRVFPWRNNWDSSRCNNDIDGQDWQIRRDQGNTTSPVTRFEHKGNSPFEVVDMVGNVWEWTHSAFKTAQLVDIEDTNIQQVVRGGSWSDYNVGVFRVALRNFRFPNVRYYYLGFRLACSIT
ncbi:MAG: SUMF1/EgtB/PvdO family nonheme iron enzyme [Chloroflexi bacterium]|nr:SUMF1/EgtB/PvdO family nonheme iron enzyme [Chloroflexota bacterium]